MRWTQIRKIELSIPISYTSNNIRGFLVGKNGKMKMNDDFVI